MIEIMKIVMAVIYIVIVTATNIFLFVNAKKASKLLTGKISKVFGSLCRPVFFMAFLQIAFPVCIIIRAGVADLDLIIMGVAFLAVLATLLTTITFVRHLNEVVSMFSFTEEVEKRAASFFG
ncbi:MAG: hypothetical protein DRP11_01090 [Candidatus Aenigmatarchaeota archaeon]|nr:MAG: hypothetical protein DRP11_01090 [Candidatus Aenigmarchaeota archaeon]